MHEVVVNRCYGGFDLSEAGQTLFRELAGLPPPEAEGGQGLNDFWIARHDPALVETVRRLGSAAAGLRSELVVVQLHRGSRYRIVEYDGKEGVEQPDNIVWSDAADPEEVSAGRAECLPDSTGAP